MKLLEYYKDFLEKISTSGNSLSFDYNDSDKSIVDTSLGKKSNKIKFSPRVKTLQTVFMISFKV